MDQNDSEAPAYQTQDQTQVQYEVANETNFATSTTHQENYINEEYQQPDPYQPQNNPPPQQNEQPPPPPPPAAQQQPQQYPPPQQVYQAYGAPPSGRPAQFPAQSPMNNPAMYQNGFQPQNNAPYTNGLNQQQTAYPPQGPQFAQARPAQFPAQSPQNNPMYANGINNPTAYPPQGPHPTTGNNYNPQPNFPPKPATQAFSQANMQIPTSPVNYGIPVKQNTYVLQTTGNEGWTSGLFDCMNDPMNALMTAFFPCLTFGQIAEIVDEGHTTCGTSGILYGAIAFLIGCPCILSCTYRTKMRNKYGLVEAPAPDWATHFLCEWCALCQEYRELNQRGLDPSIGWQGNVVRMQQQQQQQVAMMPPMNQTMMG
ncbi:protein PLANT CADMIUM RESISTANCE 6-like isoform X1 [Tripterygium wilfordii]|uniref:Protein PLANT CADMIUM RESISTANCE 6-like isoform X1 n=1 Tax=Tripterygium wilfordii TaxID=458696 RepID=A0A7J7C898_TRIWF|nr:protein PLANT CADMIUM RESISTANCE 6-like [Tripterygium wilfordii]KAF5730374.1 protein PLANT CADMIUM RESISTANCE 6-like isoform X1 [Tripterygium wilfordii]